MIYNVIEPTYVIRYFNKISCPTVDTCVAVGEGNDASGAPYVVALSSQDGGKTWAKTFESSNQYVDLRRSRDQVSVELWLLLCSLFCWYLMSCVVVH